MAIRKAIEIGKTGIMANHMIIRSIILTKKGFSVTVEVFKDKDSRLANKEPIEKKIINISNADLATQVYKGIYSSIQELPEFVGAVEE